MFEVIISSVGTVGDFVPFVCLGKRLRARGHAVCLAINPAMHTLARDAGLEAVPCGRTFGPSEARRHAAVFDHLLHLVRAQRPHVAVVVTEEALGVDGVDALDAFLVRGRHAEDHRVGRPGLVVRTVVTGLRPPLGATGRGAACGCRDRT